MNLALLGLRPQSLLVLLGILLFLANATAEPFDFSGAKTRRAEPTEESNGVRLGFHIAWQSVSPAQFTRSFLPADKPPAIFGDFAAIGQTFDAPYFVLKAKQVSEVASRVTLQNGEIERIMYSVAVEPIEGLEQVSDSAIDSLVSAIQTAEDEYGVQIVIRFGHEMDGEWYIWGKKPRLFVRTYRKVALAIRRASPKALLLWSPSSVNCTWYGPNRTTVDPWSAYFPGDDVVDLVGLSLYFFGRNWPKPGNEMPEADDFVRWVSGEPANANPKCDFYKHWAERWRKPFVISETGAAFRVLINGSMVATPTVSASASTTRAVSTSPTPAVDELAMKSAWWKQIFTPSTLTRYPLLWGVVWFEHLKFELEEWRDFRSVSHGALLMENEGGELWGEEQVASVGKSELATRFREDVLSWDALVFGTA